MDAKPRALPDAFAFLNFEATYTSDDVELFRHGVEPEQIEDKWLIRAEGGEVAFYRSWTGFCIFRVTLLPGSGGMFCASDVRVNRDASEYTSTNNDEDAVILRFLIEELLLRRPSELPVAADEPTHRAI